MTTFTVLVMIALLVTIGTLITGVASMAHGGKFDQRHSHQLMAARTLFQGVALILVVAAILMAAR